MNGPHAPQDRFPDEAGGRDGGEGLDAIARVFAQEPVVPLVPRPGTFETILTESARRRRAHRRRLAGGGLLVAAVVALAVAVPAGLLPRDHDTRTQLPLATSPHTSTSTAPSSAPPSRTPSPTPSASTPAASSPAVPVLPPGGPVPPGTSVVSVTTAAAHALYALGSVASCATPPCGVLVRSLDDGASWVGLRPPVAAVVTSATDRSAGPGRDPAGSIREVRFAGPLDGWAFGASTWVTHDGGAQTASWHRVSTPGTVLDLTTDGTTVWALAADCSGAAQGGGTCRSPQLLTGPARGDQLAVDAPATALLPAQVTSAVVQAASGQVVLDVDAPGGATVLVSDGGPWQKVATPDRCQDPTVVPTAQASGVLWALCTVPGSNAAGSRGVVTATSTDGGRSWSGAGKELRVTNGLAVLAGIDAHRAALATGAPGLAGALQTTPDGGRTWSRGDGLPAQPGGWAWVGAAGNEHLLALPVQPGDAIWASADAGLDWNVLTVA